MKLDKFSNNDSNNINILEREIINTSEREIIITDN